MLLKVHLSYEEIDYLEKAADVLNQIWEVIVILANMKPLTLQKWEKHQIFCKN